MSHPTHTEELINTYMINNESWQGFFRMDKGLPVACVPLSSSSWESAELARMV